MNIIILAQGGICVNAGRVEDDFWGEAGGDGG